jgi:hypothetical protein
MATTSLLGGEVKATKIYKNLVKLYFADRVF